MTGPAQSIEMRQAPACSVSDGARYLGVSEPTVWRMLRSGELTRIRVRGRTLIRYSDMDALLNGGSGEAT